jgi:hypothetical protein
MFCYIHAHTPVSPSFLYPVQLAFLALLYSTQQSTSVQVARALGFPLLFRFGNNYIFTPQLEDSGIPVTTLFDAGVLGINTIIFVLSTLMFTLILNFYQQVKISKMLEFIARAT